MPFGSRSRPLALPMPAAVLLASAYATNAPPPASTRKPELPSEARQPTPPDVCLQTCSEGWQRLRTEVSTSLTQAGVPASVASGPAPLMLLVASRTAFADAEAHRGDTWVRIIAL